MPNDRFLLIKAGSHNLWGNVNHLMEQLLAAEITKRIPVVYWGTNCLYDGTIYNNAFDLYFEPISPYTAYELMNPKYTCYPKIWEYDNLMSDDPDRLKLTYRNTGDMMTSEANVVVSDVSTPMKHMIPWISREHPAYGMTPIQIYRYLYRKYLKIKPDIEEEIREFYDAKLKNEDPVLAVHMPGDFTHGIYPQLGVYYRFVSLDMLEHKEIHRDRHDTFQYDETTYLHEIARILDVTPSQDPYKLYHPEIRKLLGRFGIKKIFLITDREDILEEYMKSYGSMLVFGKYKRIDKNDPGSGSHLENHLNKRSKGIENIKDAYLASKCAFFIGYGSSNLSHAATRLKDWSESNIKLAYWMFEKLHNFSCEFMKTGRHSPEESDGKCRMYVKQARDTIKRIQRILK